jgi:hypothetical protein
MVSTPAWLAERRILDAINVGNYRRHRLQRRLYERDTRLDVDAADIKLDRHHRSELVSGRD